MELTAHDAGYIIIALLLLYSFGGYAFDLYKIFMNEFWMFRATSKSGETIEFNLLERDMQKWLKYFMILSEDDEDDEEDDDAGDEYKEYEKEQAAVLIAEKKEV